MDYYKPCKELEQCHALDQYWHNKEFKKWVEGYIKIAEETGYALAECQVGYAYFEGIGVEKDLTRSFYWTEKAANHNDRDGQFNLGWMYENGIGIKQDKKKAFFWYEKAALQDHDLAIQKIKGEKIPSLLMEWYQTHARKLPWRNDTNPYRIWISEIMLQQTRVDTVIPYFKRFLEELPTIFDLAKVSEETLYKLWQGLGYYSRAKNLQKAAKIVVEQYDGLIPENLSELLNLPGIGLYTAGAIASIAYQKQTPAVDGNVMRVLSRIYGKRFDSTTQTAKQEISSIVKELIPVEQPGIFNQALMELGATICLPNGKPKCEDCPVHTYCTALKKNLMDDIPGKNKKKKRIIQKMTVLLVKVDDGWLIHKRSNQGLLAGLWEFPNLQGNCSHQEIIDFLSSYHIESKLITPIAKAKHIFTHLEWHMQFYLVEGKLQRNLKKNYIIATKMQIKDQYSIPTAFSSAIKIIS